MPRRLSDIPTDELRLILNATTAAVGAHSESATILRRELDNRDAETTDWVTLQHGAELVELPYAVLRRMATAGLIPGGWASPNGDIRLSRPELLRWHRSLTTEAQNP